MCGNFDIGALRKKIFEYFLIDSESEGIFADFLLLLRFWLDKRSLL